MAKPQGTYVRSELLSPDENRIVEQMYSPKREVLACSVAQLFHAAPNPRVWAKQQTGVVVLIKDHNQRSYFLQFVNIDTHTATYSEELYLEMEYKAPYDYFHTFAGERCTVGLNFCHDEEARVFNSAVQLIVSRNKKRKEKMDAQKRPRAPPAALAPPTPAPVPVPSPEPGKKDKKDKKDKKKKDKKKKGISKADISGPSNFQHLTHLGWDKDKNQFDESQIHPALKDLLETAGIKTTALKDEGTAEFIKTFVESHGGMDTLVKEKQRRATIKGQSHGRGPPPAPPSAGGYQPPPPPAAHVRAPPPPSARTGPPPPPGRQVQPPPPVARQNRGPPPPPTSRGAPPPPSRGGPPPPAPAARAPPAPAAPKAPPAPRAPAAPPAPRAPAAPPAPSLNKVAPSAPAPQAGRGGLLEEIRLGKALKSVDTPSSESSGASGGGGGGGLLAEIRNFGGARGGLKSVTCSDGKDSAKSSKSNTPRSGRASARQEEPEADDQLEGMAGALARALAERKKAVIEDSDKDTDDDSDDDWSD